MFYVLLGTILFVLFPNFIYAQFCFCICTKLAYHCICVLLYNKTTSYTFVIGPYKKTNVTLFIIFVRFVCNKN